MFALTVALLNRREINFREYFQQTGLSADYNYGFLIAVSSADIYTGSANIEKIVVDEFEGADEKFLALLIDLILQKVDEGEKLRIRQLTLRDLGRIRTYLEEHGLRHFGTLEPFVKEPLIVKSKEPAAIGEMQ